MKNLIIGYASGYEWNTIQYWVNSIKQTGFVGDVVVIGNRMSNITASEIFRAGAYFVPVVPREHVAPHVDRFFHIASFLNQNSNDYKSVLTTDIKDVIFQENPFANYGYFSEIVCGDEGLKYLDEPWGLQNICDTFEGDSNIIEQLKTRVIYNVGVFGGPTSQIITLCEDICRYSMNRSIKICDQAVFNYILSLLEYMNTITTINGELVFHLGTTNMAVIEGAGDVGLKYRNDLRYYMQHIYQGHSPYINTDERNVVLKDGKVVPIIHQYDRIPVLKNMIQEKYKSNV